MEILSLLENVDIKSRESLEMVSNPLSEWLWENIGDKWEFVAQKHILSVPKEFLDIPHSDALVFLFSRDALKSIRPEGWKFLISDSLTPENVMQEFSAIFIKHLTQKFQSPWLPTEELAELHAIIQVIEYERKK